MRKRLIAVTLVSLLTLPAVAAQRNEAPTFGQSIRRIQQRIVRAVRNLVTIVNDDDEHDITPPRP
jgi:hypothetical protein